MTISSQPAARQAPRLRGSAQGWVVLRRGSHPTFSTITSCNRDWLTRRGRCGSAGIEYTVWPKPATSSALPTAVPPYSAPADLGSQVVGTFFSLRSGSNDDAGHIGQLGLKIGIQVSQHNRRNDIDVIAGLQRIRHAGQPADGDGDSHHTARDRQGSHRSGAGELLSAIHQHALGEECPGFEIKLRQATYDLVDFLRSITPR